LAQATADLGIRQLRLQLCHLCLELLVRQLGLLLDDGRQRRLGLLLGCFIVCGRRRGARRVGLGRRGRGLVVAGNVGGVIGLDS
jgi:hypothetical protein